MISALVIATEVLVIAAAVGVTGWVVLALAVACHWAWVTLRDSWRRARAVIEQTEAEGRELPEPYQPTEEAVSRVATVIFCPLCHPGGHGRCTCVTFCGDRQCTYDHTGRFSAEEAAWLRGLGITEGGGQ